MEDTDLEMKPATAPFPAIAARTAAADLRESTERAVVQDRRSYAKLHFSAAVIALSAVAIIATLVLGGLP